MSRKLFVIALNYYDTEYELSGCLNDVEAIEAKYRTLGFTDVTRWVERSSNTPNKQPTLQALSNWIKSSKSGDFLAFHYSGHGTQVADTNRDEKDRMDEAICLMDEFVTDDELKRILVDQLPAGVKLRCFFDCCHSGTIVDLPWNWKAPTSLASHKFTFSDENKDHSTHDIIMISGCADPQTSADAWIEEHKKNEGAMTWAWLKVLNKLESSKLPTTWYEVVQRMRILLRDGGYDQVPQLSTGDKKLIDTSVDFLKR